MPSWYDTMTFALLNLFYSYVSDEVKSHTTCNSPSKAIGTHLHQDTYVPTQTHRVKPSRSVFSKSGRYQSFYTHAAIPTADTPTPEVQVPHAIDGRLRSSLRTNFEVRPRFPHLFCLNRFPVGWPDLHICVSLDVLVQTARLPLI